MKAFLCGVVLALLTPVFSFGQKGFGISPKPSWVKPVVYSNTISDTANVSGGYYYLLFDQQVNIEKQETYYEIAIKVTNDSGLSSASEINESFDPVYQKLNFNSLYVQRGDKKIDKLVKSDFELIRREQDLSRAMYDGSLSAINNLKDVMSGDIVVYSFTVTGFNPIFSNHFSRAFYVNRGAATGKLSVRILASPKRKLNFKWIGPGLPVTESKEGIYNTYAIVKENVESIRYEDRVPGWYDYYNLWLVSDFKDWNELTQWCSTLFRRPAKYSGGLKKFIDSVKNIGNKDEQALTAIRTIQDKIRYLSLSNGLNSHKPHSPSDVFDNKYGDCKDKSFLLSQILTEVGVESHPILVNTEKGKSLDQRLPSTGLFDHCIVQFKLRDSLYYVDPTMSFQRGGLSSLYTPDYYYGIVADVNQPGLISIPQPKVNHSLIRVTEEFDLGDPGDAVRFKVVSFYTGSEADNIRDYKNANTVAELSETYLNFYTNDYPEIRLAKQVSFKDDPVKNEVTVEEHYEIPGFWRYDESDGRFKGKTRAAVLTSYLMKPGTKSRSMPFNLKFPLDIEESIVIRVPEDYDMGGIDDRVEGPGFRFSASSTYYDKAFRLKYSLYNNSAFVEASDTREYLDKIDQIYDNTGYLIKHHQQKENTVLSSDSQSGSSVGSGSRNTLVILTTIFFLVGCVVAIRLYRHDPKPNIHGSVYHDFDTPLIL